MNTANKITMIRVVLVPIFMVLFMIDKVMCHYAALGVFVLASITDAIDGHVARKYNQVTTFGKFVDPLASNLRVFINSSIYVIPLSIYIKQIHFISIKFQFFAI